MCRLALTDRAASRADWQRSDASGRAGACMLRYHIQAIGMQLVCFPPIGLQLVLCAFLHIHICAQMRATGSGFCALVRRSAQNSAAPDMRRGIYRPADALGGTLQRQVSFGPPPYGQPQTSHFGAFWRAAAPILKTWMHKPPYPWLTCHHLGQRLRPQALRARGSNSLVAARCSKSPCAVPYAAAPVNILKPLISLA